MLRDYQYNENWRLLDKAIESFIDLPDRLSLIGFQVLSPDSFLWKIFDGKNIYYLYAEDYVPSLDHVTAQIKDFWPNEIKLEFLPVKKQVAFEDSGPNRTSESYSPPKDEYEFTKYAWPSGYDFVFLLKSSETIADYETPE